MTRINANIDPADLCDQHLIAEYREMVRIPNFVLKHPIKLNTIPDTYRLGTGHVKFFYNKIRFLHHRFVHIKMVMHSRNIKNNMEDDSFVKVSQLHPEYYRNANLNYANTIVIERIIERINNMSKVTMNGKALDKDLYCLALKTKYGNTTR